MAGVDMLVMQRSEVMLRNHDDMKLRVLLGEIAADSLKKGESKEDYIERLTSIRNHVHYQIQSMQAEEQEKRIVIPLVSPSVEPGRTATMENVPQNFAFHPNRLVVQKDTAHNFVIKSILIGGVPQIKKEIPADRLTLMHSISTAGSRATNSQGEENLLTEMAFDVVKPLMTFQINVINIGTEFSTFAATLLANKHKP